MDISILTALGAGLIGLLVGWLVASLRQQQQQTEFETQRRLLEQSLEQVRAENDAVKVERQSSFGPDGHPWGQYGGEGASLQPGWHQPF